MTDKKRSRGQPETECNVKYFATLSSLRHRDYSFQVSEALVSLALKPTNIPLGVGMLGCRGSGSERGPQDGF